MLSVVSFLIGAHSIPAENVDPVGNGSQHVYGEKVGWVNAEPLGNGGPGVQPGGGPASRSACRTHFRSVSDVQPILAAMDPIVAHWEPYSPWCSRTIRTARSRTSGEYLLGLPN